MQLAPLFVALGIGCVLYGITIMLVDSGTWFFAFWYALAGVFFGCAYVVGSGLWDSFPVAARRGVCAGACVLLLGFAITQCLALSGFSQHGEDGLDRIIVLGAQVRESGPSTILKYRLDEACDYLERNKDTRCIVSGGKGPNEKLTEAAVMAEYLEGRGVDPNRITIEAASTNTAENIENCKALVEAATERIGIVTNNFHVFRGCAIARKKGFAHVCGIAAYSHPWYLPNNMVRESFGIAKDFFTGNL